VERIVVPLLLFTSVGAGWGDQQEEPVDVPAEWAYLKSLESSRRTVNFQIFGTSTSVVVRRVEVPEGAVRGFADARRYFDQVTMVHLMSMEA
jgi:hypothetical protein